MDCYDAVSEILDKASEIRLSKHRLDIVAEAQQEFARRGCCDNRLISPIEQVLKDFLKLWTVDQKREIWESTETGAGSDVDFDIYDESSIDMDLEGELMYHVIEALGTHNRRNDPGVVS